MASSHPIEEKLEALGRLIAGDPALAEQLKSLVNPSDVPDALCRVAEQHGIPLTRSDLAEGLAQMMPRAEQVRDLTDAELDAVAGGNLVSAVFFSLVTAVAGCIITSLVANGLKGDCAKELGYDRPHRI